MGFWRTPAPSWGGGSGSREETEEGWSGKWEGALPGGEEVGAEGAVNRVQCARPATERRIERRPCIDQLGDDR